MNQTSIPAAKLRVSKQNVRKIGATENLAPLLASIIAHGVLQNLLVTPADDKGVYSVFAGGRRLRAVQQGIKSGALAKGFELPVTIITGEVDDQTEKSLAENVVRRAMSPADECRAYQDFMGDTPDIAAVAERFGQSHRYIEGRLRLAKLAKPIFAALSKGEITLEVASAYCGTTDQAKQLAVWAAHKDGYGHSFANIRRAINDGGIASDHPVARFVGEPAYLAAGGRITNELFLVDETTNWIDGHIATDLATAKMETLSEAYRATQGLGWIIPTLDTHPDWQITNKLHAFYPRRIALSDVDQARASELEAQMEALQVQVENGAPDDGATIAASAKFEALETEHSAIADKSHVIPAEIMTDLGVFMVLNRDGTPEAQHQLYSRTAPKRAGANGGPCGAGDGNGDEASTSSPGFSAKLLDELSIQRRDILALHLAAEPALALDLAIFQLASDAAGQSAYDSDCTVAITSLNDPHVGQMPPSSAATALMAVRDTLDMSWLHSGEPVQSFTTFRALPESAKVHWLAYAVSRSLSVARRERKAHSLHGYLASVLGVDVAAHWRPTAQNYFDRVSKGSILATLSEFGGAAMAGRFTSSKKGDLAKAAEKICAGDTFMEAGEKARAVNWTPAPMRFDTVAGFGDDDVSCENLETAPVAHVHEALEDHHMDDAQQSGDQPDPEMPDPKMAVTDIAPHDAAAELETL